MPDRGRPELLRRILDEIAREGPRSFARFMELALYDPDHGYYAAGQDRLGRSGDYVTASDAGHELGRCMARQVAEIDREIGPLDPFHVIEVGGGRGLLARDLLDAMTELDPSLARRLRYVLVDRSDGMRREAARNAPEAEVLAPEALGGGHRGCVLAVELFDALPVHRVRRRDGALVELCVDADPGGRLVESEQPPEAIVAGLAERYGAAPEEGQQAEVCPGAAPALELMASCLERGVILAVDYGDEAPALYGPDRPQGTLVAYHRHRLPTDLLARVGLQDLTAHVNFSALDDHARSLGLLVLGRTTQDRFLVANGILEAFEPGATDVGSVKRRLQAMQLIHPEGMGRRFSVLAYAKGCTEPPRLTGLVDPFGRASGNGS